MGRRRCRHGLVNYGVALCFAAWVGTGAATAATIFKTDTVGISQSDTNDWSSTSPTVTPVVADPTDVAEFGELVGTRSVYAISEPTTLEGMSFVAGLANAATINGGGANRLVLGSAGLTVAAASQNVTFNSEIQLGANQIWTSSNTARLLTINGAITQATAGTTLTLKGDFPTDHGAANGLNPTIAQVGSASQRGFLFTGADANTYTGLTTLNTGLLILKKDAGVTAIAGNLTANGAAAIYLASSHQIADTSIVTLTGGAKLILNGHAETIGGLVSSGTNSLVQSTESGSSANSTLTIHTQAATTYHFQGGLIRNGGSGPMSIVKEGAGTQILEGALIFNGGLTINGGILALRATGNNNYNGNTRTVENFGSNITVNAGGTLELQHTNAVVYTETLSRTITGAGKVVKSGAGAIRLNQANNTYTGDTEIAAGSLEVAGGNGIGNSSMVALSNTANARLQLNADETVGGLSGGGTTGGNVALQTFTLTVGGKNTASTYAGAISGAGGLTKIGTATQTLSGVNSYTGQTRISAGTLAVSGGSALSNSTAVLLDNVAGATFLLNNTEAIGSLNGGGSTGGTVNLQANALHVSSGSFAGVITGGNVGGANPNKFSSLVKQGTGTLYLTGTSNNYQGFTEINGGILNVASLGNLGQDSSIGNRGAEAASSDVGLIFRGGTLQYTGSTAQSTNRHVRVSINNAVTGVNVPDPINGGAFIDASGSNLGATLSFTAARSFDFFESSGERQITLTGTNQGNNVWNIAVVQTGGVTTLNKTGTGTWLLTSTGHSAGSGTTHSYTGATNIRAGALLINSTFSFSSAMNVSAGATLGGNGLIGGITTISGRLSPGADSSATNQNYATGFGVNTLSFAATSRVTFTGTGASYDVQLATGGSSDRINLLATSGTSLALGTDTRLEGAYTGNLTTDAFTSIDDTAYSRYWIATLADGASRTGLFANGEAKNLAFWNSYFGGGVGVLDSAWDGAHLVTFGGMDYALFYNAKYDAALANQAFSGGNDLLLLAVGVPEPGRAFLVSLALGMLVWRRRR